MNPFLAGQEFDACVSGEWYHVIVQRSELTVGYMDPLRLTVDMVLLPLECRGAEMTRDITEWNVREITDGKED